MGPYSSDYIIRDNKTEDNKFISLQPNKRSAKANMNKASAVAASQRIKLKAYFVTKLMLLGYYAGLVQKYIYIYIFFFLGGGGVGEGAGGWMWGWVVI